MPATAPYNFIPYDPEHLVPAHEQEKSAPEYSGIIHCTLTALTPLLVAGPQDKTDPERARERRFFTVEGKPCIPGSSLKGMLRSFVEIISHSHLSPVNRKKFFWRNVIGTNYRRNFAPEEVIQGGFLIRRGSRYFLSPVNVKRGTGSEAYYTGYFGGNRDGYIFSEKTNEEFLLSKEVVEDFFDQMTEAQESNWKDERNNLDSSGARVFYTMDQAGNITALGTARYFRIAYRQTVENLTGPVPENDFAQRLFGCVGKQARRGKVAVSAAHFSEYEELSQCHPAILMQPHPSCLLHYLEQPGADEYNNNMNDLVSYNTPNARLRGRKYYWHRKALCGIPRYLQDRINVQSILYALRSGAKATFDIRVDRLTEVELGALLEALELPAGHAHKLGMGKGLGFGSVRIDVTSMEVSSTLDRYISLEDRFQKNFLPLDETARKEKYRSAFRKYVGECMGKLYEELIAIQELALITNYKQCPKPDKIKPMPLERQHGEPNFASSKALLPSISYIRGGTRVLQHSQER